MVSVLDLVNDSFKIIKVIKSCETVAHLVTTLNMIKNFHKLHKKEYAYEFEISLIKKTFEDQLIKLNIEKYVDIIWKFDDYD